MMRDKQFTLRNLFNKEEWLKKKIQALDVAQEYLARMNFYFLDCTVDKEEMKQILGLLQWEKCKQERKLQSIRLKIQEANLSASEEDSVL